MKHFSISAALVLATAGISAPAVAATTIGTDGTWTVGSVPVASGVAGAVALTPTTAVTTPSNTQIPGSYEPNRTLSKWISPNINGSAPGFYNFLGRVNLVSLDGVSQLTSVRYWADNALLQVLVNGTAIFTANPVPSPESTQFAKGPGLTFTSNVSAWQLGSNTIEFILRNGGTSAPGNPTALMAEVSVPGSVPEPGTWMLMILGLGAVGFAMRRRQNASVNVQFA